MARSGGQPASINQKVIPSEISGAKNKAMLASRGEIIVNAQLVCVCYFSMHVRYEFIIPHRPSNVSKSEPVLSERVNLYQPKLAEIACRPSSYNLDYEITLSPQHQQCNSWGRR